MSATEKKSLSAKKNIPVKKATPRKNNVQFPVAESKEVFKFREAIADMIREPLIVLTTDLHIMSANRAFYQHFHEKPHETEGHFIFEIGNGQWNISGLKEKLLEINSKNKGFENYEVTHNFPGLGKRIILFSGLKMASDENKKSRILLAIDDITLRREAEEKLKHSLQLNISILNSISDIFISVDNDWRLIFINEPAKKFIGEKEDLVGKNFWEILPRYIDTGFHVKLTTAMRTRKFEQFEYYDDRTGEWYQFRLYSSKEALSIYANRVLEKAKNRWNFSLVAESVGTFIWNLKNNKITWTKVQESLYGLNDDTFKGTLNDWLGFIHPDDVKKTQKHIKKSIEEHTELSTEFRIFWPDGSLHWILCRAHTTFDEDGTPIEMNGINIDITDRKTKDQIIKENEERFRTLVQNSFDIITVFNSAGIVTYQSDSIERVLGYNAKERVGTNIFDKSIVYPEDREIEKKLFQKCTDKPNQYILGEFRMMHVNGSIRVMEVGCINLLNNSSIKGIIKNYRDVTERRAVEKQKEEFIGIASHELKTPVTSIKAYTQILHETLLEKKDFSSADMLSRMNFQIDKLTSLIKNLLDVTKITEGKLELKEEEFDMNELLKDVAAEMQVTSKKHKITQELGILKPIIADKERISQVLINLMSNAIKYSPDATEIIVKTSAADKEIIVCVLDFGIGITQDMQKKLFQRFFRVVDDSTRTFPGLGLGLFICAEIIKRQHGRIWVESVPGKGASFCFALPYQK